MYNHMLDTFISVADCKSFTKAAEVLFISPTAVMKQINSLENHLDLKLFDRTPTGVQLPAAGKIIYQVAKFIIDYYKKHLINENIDFLIGVCDSKAWLSLCNFLPLGRYKKMVAVSREHPLAQKKLLKVQALYG